MRQHQPDPAPGAEPERGFIVAVLGSDVDPDEELGEFRELARTAGVDPVAEIVQKRPRPDERTYVGKGKLQVELAQLDYNIPRMRGMWQHLERLGGGVGTRGPGESQLETDRRLARRRISLLRRRLRDLSKQRATRRKSRTRSQTPRVSWALARCG